MSDNPAKLALLNNPLPDTYALHLRAAAQNLDDMPICKVIDLYAQSRVLTPKQTADLIEFLAWQRNHKIANQ